jgi:nicotinamidase-related amidase
LTRLEILKAIWFLYLPISCSGKFIESTGGQNFRFCARTAHRPETLPGHAASWELHPEIKARPHVLLVEKTLPGSFTDTSLESWLRENGITTVTIAGYMTHMCCDTTARQAVHRGFTVEFLRDATGTLDLSNEAGEVTAEELHRSILCAQQMLLSEVLDVESWIARIAG